MAIAAWLLAAAVATRAPAAASPVFLSIIYTITFRAPAHSWSCPLPHGWEGSDHGTTAFLTRPRACAPQGFPSSGRNIVDRALVPAIDVFYAYGDVIPPDRCRPAGRIGFLGKTRPLCRTELPDGVQLTVDAGYMSDIPSMVAVTLTTTNARLATDLPVFRALAASLHSCRTHTDVDGTRMARWRSHGPVCPRDGQYF